MNKSPYIAISNQHRDESMNLPDLCKNCFWRTGRVCMFPVCIRTPLPLSSLNKA